MIVKLTNALSGSRFTYRPRQVIECSEKTGERLIEHGVATEAPEGSIVEGKLTDGPPKKRAAAKPERAEIASPESAVTRGKPAHCAGETKAGKPCKRSPDTGSRFCAQHGAGG